MLARLHVKTERKLQMEKKVAITTSHCRSCIARIAVLGYEMSTIGTVTQWARCTKRISQKLLISEYASQRLHQRRKQKHGFGWKEAEQKNMQKKRRRCMASQGLHESVDTKKRSKKKKLEAVTRDKYSKIVTTPSASSLPAPGGCVRACAQVYVQHCVSAPQHLSAWILLLLAALVGLCRLHLEPPHDLLLAIVHERLT